MIWLNIEAFHYGQQYMAHVAPNVHQLYIILIVKGRPAHYRFTHILLNVASWCCYFRFYGLSLNAHARSYFQLVYWQHSSGLTGHCVAALSKQVAQWMKLRSVGSFRIHSYLAQEFLQPWLAVVQNVRKMITKRSGTSWGIDSKLQVKME